MLHRVRQFRDTSVRPSPADLALARDHLPADLFSIFLRQHERDIVHSARVARWLLDRGHTDPDLLAAAFLHDVGKGHQRRRDRVAFVLATWSRVARPAASPTSRFAIRRAMARSLSHSEAGAAALRDAGAPLRVVGLVERHHARASGDAMLALLQQADAAN